MSSPGWRKSSYSGAHDCVEVGTCACDEVLMRDSKDQAGPVLRFTRADWGAFLAEIAAGRFDI